MFERPQEPIQMLILGLFSAMNVYVAPTADSVDPWASLGRGGQLAVLSS